MDPVIEAIWNNDPAALEALLEGGADANATESGKSALLWACSLRAAACAKTLLDHGANPNFTDPLGGTPLIAASFAGDLDVVAALLSKAADPRARDADGATALMAAAKAGHADVVRRLAVHGADPGAVDSRGRTALHWSLTQGDHAEIVELLLKLGADPTAQSADGLTALDYARKLARQRSTTVLGSASN